MGLFASNKTVKFYFDEQGKIVEKETPDWVEVYETATPAMMSKNQLGKMRYEFKDNEPILIMEDIEPIAYEFLAEAVVRWSEKEPPTLENIKKKLRFDIARELYSKLVEYYGIIK